MYNPSRGGVRGGADQFTWEGVKTDKHRENYLGHSLKAPVGRWQKGKDLSWYAKERKEDKEVNKLKRTELSAIKRAEEEAMLIALGQNVVKKDFQPLSKEDMKEALKRNIGERDDRNVERVIGVGAGNRKALLRGVSSKLSNEGVAFEITKQMEHSERQSSDSLSTKRQKKKKKSKKHKSEKKRYHSDSDESSDLKSHKKSRRKHAN